MTVKLNVSTQVSAEVPGTRTFAFACNELLDVSVYSNQVTVQQFLQTRKDTPSYKYAIVEMLNGSGNQHAGGNGVSLNCTLLQAFDTFADGILSSSLDSGVYNVYIVTLQSPNAFNPTIKVVSVVSS